MSVLTTKPKFLYPTSRMFPFDEVAKKIVCAIEKRNWNVPGITIDYACYGSGEAKYQCVSSITGKNFKLTFGRFQGHLDSEWLNTAAVSEIFIPRQILQLPNIFSLEYGPKYFLYVGKSWDLDKECFMNFKLDSESRKYQRYSFKQGALKRDFSPIDNEPTYIDLNQKFNEFAEWLNKNVLEYINTFPKAKEIKPPIPME